MLFGQNQNFFNPYAQQMAQYPPQMASVMPQGPQMAPGNMPMQATQQQPQMATTSSSMLYVGSRQEAQSYMMAPGCTVVLWDTNGPYVYIKQTDASGKPTFNAFKLTEAGEETECKYVTYGELEKILADFKQATGKKKEVTADE